LELAGYFAGKVAPDWQTLVDQARAILQQEDELQQIVKLVGEEVLADDQKLTLRTARMLKVGFLQQAAFDPIDTYCPLAKQVRILRLYLRFYARAQAVIARGAHIVSIEKLPVSQELFGLKTAIGNDHIAEFDAVDARLETQMDALLKEFT
jgi:V/A-type H+-transporting ATPase subunit A